MEFVLRVVSKLSSFFDSYFVMQLIFIISSPEDDHMFLVLETSLLLQFNDAGWPKKSNQ